MMPFLTLISGALVAFLVAALTTPLVGRVAHYFGTVDVPNADRKRHREVTPTMGGIAIGVGLMAGWGYLYAMGAYLRIPVDAPSWIMWGGGAFMMLVGVYDDVKGMGFKAKFMAQLIVAYALLHAGFRIDVAGFSFISADPYQQALLSIPLTMIWIVGVINAVNLLDGLDGLAAGTVLIAFVGFGAIFGLHNAGIVPILVFAMIGALAGFLMHNFKPASIFMGDAGSLFIGFMLAAFSLKVSAHSDPALALIIPVVVLGLPVTDTAVTILRRFLSGRAVFMPDHDHIHHRLLRILSEQGTVLALYIASMWFSIAALLMATLSPTWSYVVFGVTVLSIVVGLRVLGYLHLRELGRGVRYRLLLSQRQIRNRPQDGEKKAAESMLSDRGGAFRHSVPVSQVELSDRNEERGEPHFISAGSR